MSLREPNKEQKKAIDHHGGVLLSAGAGSGKTFVLVEHIIYLIESFYEKGQFLDLIDFETKLKKYLKKIVLMTYTKKAAGELSIRLKNRVKEASLEENQQKTKLTKEHWEKVESAYKTMVVTTIHGFCYRLLSQGYFSNFDLGQDIVGNAEIYAKIKNLVKEWLEKNWTQGKVRNSFYIHEKELTNAFCQVFLSPDLRILWESVDVDITDEQESQIVSTFMQQLHVIDLFESEKQVNLSSYLEDSKKEPKWVSFYQSIIDKLAGLSLDSFEVFNNLNEYFSSLGRFSPIKKGSAVDEVFIIRDKIVALRDFCKKNTNDFNAFQKYKNAEFLNWSQEIKDLYHYIELKYKDGNGVTFSDLEYYVLKGLENKEYCEAVQSDFSYLIIDEFQDTSEIQFEIIKKIINNNYKKLFCVGDVKQAIYGFRGGELGVFREASNLIPLNLSLFNNYRSCKNIIGLNNKLFENIFPKGSGFKKSDKHSVEVQGQEYPGHKNEEGSVYKTDIFVEKSEDKKTLSSKDMDYIEAIEIFKKSKKISENEESVCILYRKLTPLKFLIPLLIKDNIGFSCQIKINIEDDPILYLFKLYIFKLKNPDDKEYDFLAKTLFEALGEEFDEESLLFDLEEKVQFWGLWESFKIYCYEKGLCNSNYSNNLELVESICRINNDNYEDVLKSIKEFTSGNYSFEFQFGDKVECITIMTAHSSKGLEFDHVILGGVHTNGSSFPGGDFFGKFPLSFKWKPDPSQKSFFKSPQYILEKMIQKEKEFSESKRLFYVACTRAETSISWFDISYDSKPVSYGDSNWINGIRSWEFDFEKKSYNVFENIKNKQTSINVKVPFIDFEVEELNNPSSFFHKDNLGISLKESKEIPIGLTSELSVTKLTSLVDCPKKFYFKNIINLKDDDLEILNEDSKAFSKEAVINESKVKQSSSERGTEVHNGIHQSIENGLILPLEIEQSSERDIIEKVLVKLRALSLNYSFISEVAVKFPLFGMMISGTPDLILQPKSKQYNPEIWDFKTGSGSGRQESYWFQLLIYAYAGFTLGLWSRDCTVELCLVFVDKNSMDKKAFSFEDVEDEIYKEWCKLENLSQENLKHCSHCEFNNICQ